MSAFGEQRLRNLRGVRERSSYESRVGFRYFHE